MFLSVIRDSSYWMLIVFVYLVAGGVAALKNRVVWLPIMVAVPLGILSMQASLFGSLSHEYQLIVLLAFLAGLGCGGTLLQPVLIASLPGRRYEVAGEWATLGLVLLFFSIKGVAGVIVPVLAGVASVIQCVSGAIGAFVPGAFLGRALFLVSIARKKPIQ